MEVHENFIKQTNRNRYHICGPGGIQSLFIPIVHQHKHPQKLRDVKISYSIPWQRNHWRTITSAYSRSAFFEYYADDLQYLFFKNHVFLYDFNEVILHWILTNLKIEITTEETTDYIKKYDALIMDYRHLSNFKNTETSSLLSVKKYPQVFEYKNGFIKNLSILDLIFCLGPQAKAYL